MITSKRSGPGFFLTLEGIEGSGKSTLTRKVADFLRSYYPKVHCTREPGGTLLGEALRNLLLEKQGPLIGARAECLLFAAARAQHLEEVIEPALSAGEVVVCDRYMDSTLAYQGAGRGLDKQRIEALHDWLAPALRPDLTLLLDLPVEQGLRRRQSDNDEADRFDSEARVFHEAVRMRYLELARSEPKRIYLLDASQPFAKVVAQMREVLTEALRHRAEKAQKEEAAMRADTSAEPGGPFS